MLIAIALILTTTLVAYANGANDNFKGVATLYGSGTTHFAKALGWANFTTFLGSVTALFLAEKLIRTFSGKGLVPDAIAQEPLFGVSVLCGAGLTVLFATRFGVPISTTHSLIGALVGTAAITVGSEMQFGILGRKFAVPLLLSPIIAVFLTAMIYWVFRKVRLKMGVGRETCFCIGEKEYVLPVRFGGMENLNAVSLRALDLQVDHKELCSAEKYEKYRGRVMGFDAQKILDGLHFLSSGSVSFARGLNDTPKIVALLIALGTLDARVAFGGAALAMLIGGVISSKRVGETMSHKITGMNHGQGFAGNLVTAFLVIFASKLGVPVSTTHVSCGALFGIGAVNKQARWNVIGGILSAWFLTLPLAAIFAALSYGIFSLVI